MKIKMEQLNARAWRLRISRRLDPDSADAARLVFAAMPDDAEVITVDCAALNDVTLAGLRELLIARRRFAAGIMRLVNVRPKVMETLNVSGFKDFFEVSAEEEPGPEYMRVSFRDFLSTKHYAMPERVAVVSEAGEHTWREIDACADVIASDLARLGVRKGSHVAICGRNSINWIYTFFAVQKLGAVAALINPGLKAAEIASVALGGDAEFLCCGEILEMKDEEAFLQEIEAASGGRLTRFYSIRNSVDFRARQLEPVSYPLAPSRGDDPALMIFTSGYTGTPKGVLLSAWGVLNASRGSAARFSWQNARYASHVSRIAASSATGSNRRRRTISKLSSRETGCHVAASRWTTLPTSRNALLPHSPPASPSDCGSVASITAPGVFDTASVSCCANERLAS